MMTDWEEKYKQEYAARQEAQVQLEYYKGLLAKARLDLMRELREQGWTRTEGPQLTADSITVNLMRLAGLDKHKARECEQIVRAMLAAPAAPQVPAVPSWHAPAERLVKWMHCMSYNDSYFGEPAGYLKQCVNELRHLLPPHELKVAIQQCTYPQSAERVSLTAVAFEALETDLIAECERAMRQRDEFLRTGVRTGGDGMAWNTCFGFILRKHGITPNEKQV